MKNQNDLKSFWGSSLKKIDISVLELFDLNTTTLHFLRDVGLPDDATLRLQHTLEVNFYTDIIKLRSYDHEGTKYLIIGDDGGSYFCIDREHEGIFAIEYGTECMAFVNSDIEKFLKCIQIFIQCKQRFDEGTGDEASLVGTMKESFLEVDSKCLAQSTWWWIVLSQGY